MVQRFLRVGSIPFLLAGLVSACSDSTLLSPSPTPSSGSASVSVLSPICAGPLDTATTVAGVVSERTPDGIQSIGGATVELFLGDSLDSGNILGAEPIRQTLTRADGGYFMCLPPPIGGTGGTGPGGQAFEVRVRKDGYRTASRSFRFVYSVWDYDGVEVSLELVRN
jgi:hypothetical protein